MAASRRGVALSEHFKPHEFKCRHCGRVRVVPDLYRKLEKLRAIVRKPIPIVSGYRCLEHNRAVGGARESQHLLGRAADIPLGIATERQAVAAGFTGIGTSGPWVRHVDVRTGSPARWSYSS